MGTEIVIRGYKLILTCEACPEQYDVFRNGDHVGYLRLRHGVFTAEYPECGGVTLYTGCPDGDGCFRDNERMFYLHEAVNAIDRYITHTKISMEPKFNMVEGLEKLKNILHTERRLQDQILGDRRTLLKYDVYAILVRFQAGEIKGKGDSVGILNCILTTMLHEIEKAIDDRIK